jgi:hypothetical protein
VKSSKLPLKEIEVLFLRFYAFVTVSIPGTFLTSKRTPNASRSSRIEPLLYRVLVVDESKSHGALISILNSKPADFLRTAVRCLYLDCPEDNDWNMALIRKFSGVTNLCVTSEEFSVYLPALREMRLQKLAIDAPLPGQQRVLFQSATFSALTHLDVYSNTHVGSKRWEDWCDLASLPALTHLCLSECLANLILAQAITECPKLLVAISMDGGSHPSDPVFTIGDLRVVVMRVFDHVADWEVGARGGDDLWVRAERFIARKRQGEIASECFHYFHPDPGLWHAGGTCYVYVSS